MEKRNYPEPDKSEEDDNEETGRIKAKAEESVLGRIKVARSIAPYTLNSEKNNEQALRAFENQCKWVNEIKKPNLIQQWGAFDGDFFMKLNQSTIPTERASRVESVKQSEYLENMKNEAEQMAQSFTQTLRHIGYACLSLLNHEAHKTPTPHESIRHFLQNTLTMQILEFEKKNNDNQQHYFYKISAWAFIAALEDMSRDLHWKRDNETPSDQSPINAIQARMASVLQQSYLKHSLSDPSDTEKNFDNTVGNIQALLSTNHSNISLQTETNEQQQ